MKKVEEIDVSSKISKIRKLLKKVNETENNQLSEKGIKYYEKRYRSILSKGEEECPLALSKEIKRGKTKQSKSRNLLDRLRKFEDDTLRFMKESMVSFTNNRAENDLRMTKVQQKFLATFVVLKGLRFFVDPEVIF